MTCLLQERHKLKNFFQCIFFKHGVGSTKLGLKIELKPTLQSTICSLNKTEYGVETESVTRNISISLYQPWSPQSSCTHHP